MSLETSSVRAKSRHQRIVVVALAEKELHVSLPLLDRHPGSLLRLK